MNWKKNTLLAILALALTLFDISFFNSMSIGGATIVSTYVLIINFALISKPENYSNEYLFFGAFSLIAFSVFSSIPVWLLVLLFLVFPALIVYFRKNYFPMPSVLVSVVFFLLSNIVFEFFLMAYYKEINAAGFKALFYFVLINSMFGVLVYYLSVRFRSKQGEIKL